MARAQPAEPAACCWREAPVIGANDGDWLWGAESARACAVSWAVRARSSSGSGRSSSSPGPVSPLFAQALGHQRLHLRVAALVEVGGKARVVRQDRIERIRLMVQDYVSERLLLVAASEDPLVDPQHSAHALLERQLVVVQDVFRPQPGAQDRSSEL